MGEACRKFAVKTSPIPLFNFGKQPKTANAYMRLLKIGCFKRDHEKGSLIFSFAPPAPFYRQNYGKQKGLELVTSLFELQNLLTKIPVLVWSFESGNCRKKRKK